MSDRWLIRRWWPTVLLAGACVAAPAVTAHERHQTKPTTAATTDTPQPAPEGDEPAAGHAHAAEAPVADRLAARDHQAPEGVPPLLAWVGRFHPPLVHFPIALLSAAALGEILLALTGRGLFRDAVRFCVWMGALGAVSAGALGWLFGGFRVVDEEWVMTSHRWLGTGTAAWAMLTLAACEGAVRSAASRRGFRVALVVGATLVGATGFLGGALIYGIDHYAW